MGLQQIALPVREPLTEGRLPACSNSKRTVAVRKVPRQTAAERIPIQVAAESKASTDQEQ